MVIQNGSLPSEEVALGKVENIASIVEGKGMGAPGIIIIGEVVSLHPELCFEMAKKQEL